MEEYICLFFRQTRHQTALDCTVSCDPNFSPAAVTDILSLKPFLNLPPVGHDIRRKEAEAQRMPECFLIRHRFNNEHRKCRVSLKILHMVSRSDRTKARKVNGVHIQQQLATGAGQRYGMPFKS